LGRGTGVFVFLFLGFVFFWCVFSWMSWSCNVGVFQGGSQKKKCGESKRTAKMRWVFCVLGSVGAMVCKGTQKGGQISLKTGGVQGFWGCAKKSVGVRWYQGRGEGTGGRLRTQTLRLEERKEQYPFLGKLFQVQKKGSGTTLNALRCPREGKGNKGGKGPIRRRS